MYIYTYLLYIYIYNYNLFNKLYLFSSRVSSENVFTPVSLLMPSL